MSKFSSWFNAIFGKTLTAVTAPWKSIAIAFLLGMCTSGVVVMYQGWNLWRIRVLVRDGRDKIDTVLVVLEKFKLPFGEGVNGEEIDIDAILQQMRARPELLDEYTEK
jgi:hypothetical protein